MQFLGWSDVGADRHHRQEAVLTPDDLKGLKARAQPTRSRGYLWIAFGANPNPLPVTEWNSAFQTGLVDVADAPLTFYVFSGLAKVAPVVTAHQAPRPGRRHHDEQGGLRQALGRGQKEAIVGGGDKRAGGRCCAPRCAASRRRCEVQVQGRAARSSNSTPEQRAVWRKGMEAALAEDRSRTSAARSGAYWKAIHAGIQACGA